MNSLILNFLSLFLKQEITFYTEVKEVRYLYFTNASYTKDDVRVLVGNKEILFNYFYNDYFVIDLENYYPLASINLHFKSALGTKVFITNELFNGMNDFCVLYIINQEYVSINDFVMTNPLFYKMKMAFDEVKPSKVKKIVKKFSFSA